MMIPLQSSPNGSGEIGYLANLPRVLDPDPDPVIHCTPHESHSYDNRYTLKYGESRSMAMVGNYQDKIARSMPIATV